MGYWNNGMLVYWVWWNEIYFYKAGTDQSLKSEQHPVFMPNIPLFYHSSIPMVFYRQTQLHWSEIKAFSGTGLFTGYQTSVIKFF
jgi:hypothetical protein